MFRAILPARRDALDGARLSVMGHLAGGGLSPDAAHRVELVLEEVLMNIVWHAYAGRNDGRMEVQAQVQGDDVLLEFVDDGAAFDPTRARAPAMPSDIRDAQPGGLGVLLVRKFARSVSYERRDARNRLRIAIARD